MRNTPHPPAVFFAAAVLLLLVPSRLVIPGLDIDFPKTVQQGGIYPITVSGEEIVSVTGTFANGGVYLDPTGVPGVFSGLIGVHVVASAGDKPLIIVATMRDGRVESSIVHITVRETKFPTESLAVDERFVVYDEAIRERMKRESREMKAVLRREAPRRLWSEPFVVPCAGPISGEFGLTRYFNGTRSFPHAGIDICANTGETVRAANDGRVALIQDSYMGGITLLIDHGQGLYTSYCHLSGVLVTVGDVVRRGEPVALVGATGRVTGAHLHFGVFLNHHIVNPNGLLNGRFQ
jgi:murein DD-endopeptidase MepM/ murein hydrolase activator NlpD